MRNFDYANYGEICIFAGMPAVCKKQHVQRIFSYDEEAALDKVYNYIRYKL